ncbi:response regulator receiver domain-containing protein [Blastococcus colisei]|uniref:Response regulator receiver domain-containing protein n=1 Tax=Blastococcus colisei TaxID=1564162 RepID=A0A543PJM9_9ACTN|nr:response regulator [Blastococcus colisei]TQN44269.1 response regulator receiver domain-containing protein [Blastococcus colisei]
MSQPHVDTHVVRTALVVDDSAAARHRAATLLRLGGWQVVEAVGTDAALRMAAIADFDLVVTEMAMRNGHGATLIRKLRESGSRARFLVTASRRTQQVRLLAASAGAVACLAKPVDPRLFVDVMRGLAPVVHQPVEAAAPAPEPGAGARQRAEEMYASALPHRLASIAAGAREGDADAVAYLADLLAAASDRMGYTEVAVAAHAVADDARRGVVPQSRLMALVGVCSRVEGTRWGAVGQEATQATSR